MSQISKNVLKLVLVLVCLVGSVANSYIWETLQNNLYCWGQVDCLLWGSFWRFFYLGLFLFVLVASLIFLSMIKKGAGGVDRQYRRIGLFGLAIYLFGSLLFLNSYFMANGKHLRVSNISITKGSLKEEFVVGDVAQVQREWYLSGKGGTVCTTLIKVLLKNNKDYDLDFGSNQQSLEDYFTQSGFSIVNTRRSGNNKRCY